MQPLPSAVSAAAAPSNHHWSRDQLKDLLQQGLGDLPIVVVSNREPWIHAREDGGSIQAHRPASGLVAALEPFAEATGGTWIAHGSGNADRASVDQSDAVAVPPGQPLYRLRRVWLSSAEVQDYYANLSNRGLWPLCHVAFVPPLFEHAHWQVYRQVNQRFADVILQETAGKPALVFLQDYHLALVARMLRQANPRLITVQFWHVPWPNREVLRTFPYADALIDGLLGNDLIGFQGRSHAHNFLDAADRLVEARVDPDGEEVSQHGHHTRVGSYPISIDFEHWNQAASSAPVAEAMQRWQQELKLEHGQLLAVGMERLDYTKGLLQRLQAVDRLLQLEPTLRGRLRFVQILANSRGAISEYRHLRQELEGLSQQINRRWSSGGWQPIHLAIEERSFTDRLALMRLGRCCVVSSLHDGMNLVAKEFVAARCDGDGALVLSRFTGSAQELTGALLVNPYSVEALAKTLRRALQMPETQRRLRMAQMRRHVADQNVYRWGGSIVSDILQIRQHRLLHAAASELPG
ncbi:alpha,alpha-trehalose-phosphate synthase (UDP-forming) [Vulcanococcus sp.]|uniref:alpha,alpha-trehalose-phosphate synthase (UDP-forming) n=1 Tax=Vulcanococcus sp. TaxID=2856995 RepID=UPI0032272523